MFNLDPAKLLIIAVVAVILLGPDKLPQVARQIGGAWKSFNEFRHRMETEVRGSIPDLPSSNDIARLARSPSALLNHLSTMDGKGGDPNGSAPSANGNGSGNGHSNGHAAGTSAIPTSSSSPPPSRPLSTPEPSSPDGVVAGDPSLN
jgi:sec-independent protein translocase protein TatB